MYIRFDESGNITTWGDAELPGATLVASPPADFRTHGFQKYRWDGSKLVIRADYVEPVFAPEEEAEVPAEPETPADPE
jgi:hypothetical protein